MHDPNHAINMCKLSYIGQVGLPFGCYELDIHGAGSMSTRFCTPESAKLKAETSKHVLWWRFTFRSFSKASLCPQTTLYHTYRSENPQAHPATSDSKPSQTSSYHMVFHYFSTNLSNKDSESGPTTPPSLYIHLTKHISESMAALGGSYQDLDTWLISMVIRSAFSVGLWEPFLKIAIHDGDPNHAS